MALPAARALLAVVVLARAGAVRLDGPLGARASAHGRGARRVAAPSVAEAEPTPRVALVKFPRTGSTLMMSLLADAACTTKAGRERWAAEVLDRVCGAAASCDARTSLDAIRSFSNCSGREGCGWSLNLFKHQRAGLRLWAEIVEVMAAQPMTVIFLTRRDPVAQFVSYAVGTRRKALLRSAEFRGRFGRTECNAYQYYRCPREVVDWVNERTPFELDLRQMHDEVLVSRRQAKMYAKLESELRDRALRNLNIVHVTYEDLHQKESWSKLFGVIGLPAVEAPNMLLTNYSRFVRNWADVAAYSRLVGLGDP